MTTNDTIGGERKVGAEMVLVSRHDLEQLLECNRAAAQEAVNGHSGIDFIEERSGEESDDLLDRIAYHLYYGLFPAMRIRDSIGGTP